MKKLLICLALISCADDNPDPKQPAVDLNITSDAAVDAAVDAGPATIFTEQEQQKVGEDFKKKMPFL